MRLRVALVMTALGLLLVVLLVQTRRVMRRSRPPGGGPAPTEPDERVADERSPSPPPWRPLPAPPAPRRLARSGVAHLRGRVVVPAGWGADAALGGLQVTADDGRRSFAARVGPREDRFALHIPAGRYTLTAEAGDLVGVEPDVAALAETEREVTIVLEPAAAVSGRVHGAGDGVSISVRALRAGSQVRAGSGDVDGDTFSVKGLRAGQRYDLVFAGDGLRTSTVPGVVAPAEGLDVSLARLAVLRGAVGFPPGESCPIDTVGLSKSDGASADDGDGDGDGDDGVRVGRDCRFELPIPPDLVEVTVVATGPGWHIHERVAVPPQGDPDPLCLNPPCRADPFEGLARLRVTMEGDPRRASGETWMRAQAASESCSAQGTSCELEGLRVGEPIAVEVYSAGCRGDSRTVALGAGENVVSFSCMRERMVQGFVQTVAGSPPEHMVVRCSGGRSRHLQKGLVFSLTCPQNVSTLEYQLEIDGPWTTVGIPPTADPALVQIALGPR